MMRAGDTVKHRPTGEQWLLAWAENKEVGPCGWPESIAKEDDCELVELASDAEHRAMLEQCAKLPWPDFRGSVCRDQLAKLNAREGRVA